MHTPGFEIGQSDYKSSRCLAYINNQGELVWCSDADLGLSASEKEEWGREYAKGWAESANNHHPSPMDTSTHIISKVERSNHIDTWCGDF